MVSVTCLGSGDVCLEAIFPSELLERAAQLPSAYGPHSLRLHLCLLSHAHLLSLTLSPLSPHK